MLVSAETKYMDTVNDLLELERITMVCDDFLLRSPMPYNCPKRNINSKKLHGTLKRW